MSNKNIKNYYTNTANIGKTYYLTSSDSILNDINKINEEILLNQIPPEQIINEINNLQNKIRISNITNKNYINYLQNLLNNIIQQVEITNLNNEIIQLMEEITILENTPCTCDRNGFTFDPIDTNINTQIKLDYTYYIKTCGIPNSGIYLQDILDIINNYLINVNYNDIDLEYLVNIISEQTNNSIIIFNDENKVSVFNHLLV
jgi:hypothetical protein